MDGLGKASLGSFGIAAQPHEPRFCQGMCSFVSNCKLVQHRLRPLEISEMGQRCKV